VFIFESAVSFYEFGWLDV